MSAPRYTLPDDESPRARLFYRLSWAMFIIAVILGIAAKVSAQDVLVPCYEPGVGTQALAQVKDASRLVLIMNVNSGPHDKLDKAYDKLISQARQRKAKLAFYIDVMAGKEFSPVVTSGWTITVPAKPRLKTAYELKLERTMWSAFYGSPQWWFIDDVRPEAKGVIESLSSWAQPVILNPGTSYVPPATLPGAVVVIHEFEEGWPRALTRWEGRNLSRCAVISLQLSSSAGSLPAFTRSTAGMAMRYATPWSDAQGAYNKLTPYLLKL